MANPNQGKVETAHRTFAMGMVCVRVGRFEGGYPLCH